MSDVQDREREADPWLWREVFLAALSGSALQPRDSGEIVTDASDIADEAVRHFHEDCDCKLCSGLPPLNVERLAR